MDFIEEFFADNSWGECKRCCSWYVDGGPSCEVIDGREDWHECPAMSDYLDRNEVPVPKRLRRKSWG